MFTCTPIWYRTHTSTAATVNARSQSVIYIAIRSDSRAVSYIILYTMFAPARRAYTCSSILISVIFLLLFFFFNWLFWDFITRPRSILSLSLSLSLFLLSLYVYTVYIYVSLRVRDREFPSKTWDFGRRRAIITTIIFRSDHDVLYYTYFSSWLLFFYIVRAPASECVCVCV